MDISQVYEEDLDTGKMRLLIQWASDEPLELFNVSVFDRHKWVLTYLICIKSPNNGQVPAFPQGVLGPLEALYKPPVVVQVLFNLTHGIEITKSDKVILATSLLTVTTV